MRRKHLMDSEDGCTQQQLSYSRNCLVSLDKNRINLFYPTNKKFMCYRVVSYKKNNIGEEQVRYLHTQNYLIYISSQNKRLHLDLHRLGWNDSVGKVATH